MSNPEILLSVIVPAYNEQVYLPNCLRSVMSQKTDFNYEVIVVDNNSTDNTVAIANKAGVKVINEKIRGVGRARRTGTDNATGKYILHLDADTELPAGFLTKVMKYFQNNPKLACLGGQLFFYDASWWLNLIRFPLAHFFIGLTRLVSRGKLGPMGNCMVFPRKLYDKTVGFDASLHFGEDAQLCRQLSKYGQIKIDMKLNYYISARRFKLNKPLIHLAINFVKILLGQKIVNYRPPHADTL